MAERRCVWADYRRLSAFRTERSDAALASLNRLGIEPAALAVARTVAADAVAAEDGYVRSLLSAEGLRVRPRPRSRAGERKPLS